jgi:NitT/TauT family transport system ATP-binding protein
MIEIHGLTVRYGDVVVLDSLDVDLPEGSVTAVLGANGSGKTTLGRVLLGLIDATDTTVRSENAQGIVSGRITGLDGLTRSAVFQENRLLGHLSAVSNVRLALPHLPRDEVGAALGEVGLDADSSTKPVRALSGGQRRRVAVVRALLGDTDLVVLDEAFTGLDSTARQATLAWARERLEGRTVLMITHDESEIAWFDARTLRLPG